MLMVVSAQQSNGAMPGRKSKLANDTRASDDSGKSETGGHSINSAMAQLKLFSNQTESKLFRTQEGEGGICPLELSPVILTVDPNPTSISEYPNLLGTQYKVVGAESAETALNTVTSQRIDAVLLDIHTPGILDEHLLKHIREKAPYIPIMIVSSQDTVREAARAMNQGALDCLTKPYKAQDLRALVGAAIQPRRYL